MILRARMLILGALFAGAAPASTVGPPQFPADCSRTGLRPQWQRAYYEFKCVDHCGGKDSKLVKVLVPGHYADVRVCVAWKPKRTPKAH